MQYKEEVLNIKSMKFFYNLAKPLNLSNCENITQTQKDNLKEALPNLKVENEESFNQLLQNTKTSDFFKTDKQAQDWYDKLPENLRDALQINLQLQAAGKTVGEIDEEIDCGDSIYVLQVKLLGINNKVVWLTASVLNEMSYFYNPNDKDLTDISTLYPLI